MKEDLLHFIWKFQLLNQTKLETTEGEPITIQFVGEHNHNAGPDFSNAKIKIGDTLWAGTVEIHINSSDWFAHNHQKDEAYNSVILHVVWRDDRPIGVPTLVLQPLVSNLLLQRYEQLMNAQNQLPCSSFITSFSSFDWAMYREALVIERFEQKTSALKEKLTKKQNNIEQVFYEQLAYSFGLTTNADTFVRLAELVPYKLVLKYRENLFQLEALLFGCAGFLVKENLETEYAQQLFKEFQFLQSKHQLESLPLPLWNFGKIRPANFPTVRIAQFASFLQNVEHLYSKLTKQPNLETLTNYFETTPSEFWFNHYTFKNESKPKEKRLGKITIERIIINVVLPILFIKAQQEPELIEDLFALFIQLKKENNNITTKFEALGVSNKNAFESQALIHLYKNYCTPKQCIQCKVGYKALRQ